MGQYHEGTLRKNDINRGEVVIDNSRWELTSGNSVEVQVGDKWVQTRVESANGEYYSIVPGIIFHPGMRARVKLS